MNSSLHLHPSESAQNANMKVTLTVSPPRDFPGGETGGVPSETCAAFTPPPWCSHSHSWSVPNNSSWSWFAETRTYANRSVKPSNLTRLKTRVSHDHSQEAGCLICSCRSLEWELMSCVLMSRVLFWKWITWHGRIRRKSVMVSKPLRRPH